MSPSAVIPFIVLLSAVLSCCSDCSGSRDDAQGSNSTGVSNGTGMRLDSISWGGNADVEGMLAEDELRSVFEKALRSLKAPAEDAMLNADVQGDSDGNETGIFVKAWIRSEDITVPITTSLVVTGPGSDSENLKKLSARSADELVGALEGLFRIYRSDSEIWIRSLESAEPDEQVLAMRLLAEKKVVSAVPGVAELLGDPREVVAEEAADSLVKIGDESAVPLLIESIRRGDLRSEVRAIEAMGRIGGSEATAYLEMVSQGHEMPEVRRMSSDALKRLHSSNANNR